MNQAIKSCKTEVMKANAKKIETVQPEITVSPTEIASFNAYNDNWWDENGPFKPLHALNPVRIDFIKNRIVRCFKTTDKKSPLDNIKIIDVGCGAGIATEPMARLGATVTGIDASDKAITQARLHAIEQGLEIDYRLGAVESIVSSKEQFDVVMALEIIEHVDNPAAFVEHLCHITKPGGLIFISTLNRTWASYAKAILAAEYVLKWVPQGTHHWDKFITPAELAGWLRQNGFYFSDIKGIDYSFLKREWKLVHDLSTNYITCIHRS
jgi:2-polyprenyl-6-hydroxyphenyl methylase / 3-demethylubiquinone-9 3-methyltransferase